MKETNCNLCGSNEYKTVDINKNHELNLGDSIFQRDIINVICTNCGLIYNNPVLDEEDLDELYSNLSKLIVPYKEEIHPVDPYYMDQYNFIIVNIHDNKESKKVLEIGCALGDFLKIFKDNGWIEFGIEPSIEDTKYARNINKLNVLTDFFKPGLINEKFDLIILRYVFEHISDPSSYLKEFYRLLNQNGYLFIEVPDAEHPFIGFDNFFSLGHLFSYTPAILEKFLYKENFEIVKIIQSESHLHKTGIPNIRILAKKKDIQEEINLKSEELVKKNIKIFHEWKNRRSELINNTKKKFMSLKEDFTHKKIFIWGAGTHSSELLKNNIISENNISGFIDSNPSLIKNTFHSIKVYSPEELNSLKPDFIIVSSRISEIEIIKVIKKISENPNQKIITIYNE